MAGITLLSDFGLHSASAGAVKGVLYTAIPGIQITDISHEVPPFDTEQAAYLLRSAYAAFPEKTTHLVLVDIYYGAQPKLILSAYKDQYFLAPDNGIIPLALNAMAENSWLCFELANGKTFNDWLQAAANIIKQLQSQSPDVLELQPYTPQAFPTSMQQPQGNTVACNVIYIDHFGNVVTDMGAATFNAMNRNNRFTLRFMQVNEITAVSASYTDVRQGENLCRINKSGYLEICVNKGSAASLFGFRVGSKHNDIKITFE